MEQRKSKKKNLQIWEKREIRFSRCLLICANKQIRKSDIKKLPQCDIHAVANSRKSTSQPYQGCSAWRMRSGRCTAYLSIRSTATDALRIRLPTSLLHDSDA
jgi:hypothetical protein